MLQLANENNENQIKSAKHDNFPRQIMTISLFHMHTQKPVYRSSLMSISKLDNIPFT